MKVFIVVMLSISIVRSLITFSNIDPSNDEPNEILAKFLVCICYITATVGACNLFFTQV